MYMWRQGSELVIGAFRSLLSWGKRPVSAMKVITCGVLSTLERRVPRWVASHLVARVSLSLACWYAGHVKRKCSRVSLELSSKHELHEVLSERLMRFR